jgi:adenine-specific DNA methylase
MTDRRFIEETVPVKEVSAISAREKNIRHGHISTLHIWWARRPLASSRATAYAALTPATDDVTQWQKQRDFIVEMSKWENSLNPSILEKARQDILKAHAERLSAERGEPVTVEDIEAGRAPRPRVLDPFAGGGAIPLEALRLGCETYASDYNPVAVLILKATLEYPQKYGTRMNTDATDEHGFSKSIRENPSDPRESVFYLPGLEDESRTINPLLEAVKWWGDWVLEEARKELADFYPPDPDGSIPVGYIWARTIPCQNPACGAEIPLMRQFWLAKKTKKKVALYPVVEWNTDDTDATDGHGSSKKIRANPSDPSKSVFYFRIVGDGYAPWPEGFDPSQGTVSRAVATCPVCGSVVEAKTTRRLFQEGKAGQRMVAVVLKHPQRRGKTYRVATVEDERVFHQAGAALQEKREHLMLEWGLNPVPDEPFPSDVKMITEPLGSAQNYGFACWGDLFSARQKVALVIFTEKVRQVHKQILEECSDSEFATAVTTYLALGMDRLTSFSSTLTRWQHRGEFAVSLFGRQALQMVWDYFEVNPSSGATGSWSSALGWIIRVIEHCSQIPVLQSFIPVVTQASTTQLPYPDGYFDAVLTDPPYYDNVPYSYISDFFYIWLKRTVGHLYPDLFSTPLTPKTGEIVAYSFSEGRSYDGRHRFEESLGQAFQEIRRVLKPEGLTVIVYAHKSTAGWETVINALLDSGLVITGAWPLHTERGARPTAKETAALASSIYIVARKMARQPTGFYNEVREELRQHLDRKLHRLWEEGIGGADFFIAAIGSAIEVFGKYEQVMDYEGNIVRADRLLEDVRTIATDYAVRQILQDGFTGEVSDLTRLYVLWRWNYGEARVPFDEARKLAQSCGVDLAREWGRRGFVRKEREFVRLLGPQKRNLDDLEKDDTRELIDVLHRVLLLWEKGRREELVQVLVTSGYGRSEAFYRVAQAVSETLPNDSKEKKLLDGFLVGRERVREEVAQVAQQGRLWDTGV